MYGRQPSWKEWTGKYRWHSECHRKLRVSGRYSMTVSYTKCIEDIVRSDVKFKLCLVFVHFQTVLGIIVKHEQLDLPTNQLISREVDTVMEKVNIDGRDECMIMGG